MSDKKVVTPSESTLKNAKTCYSMFDKWRKAHGKESSTIADYVKACIDGYPRKTKMKPFILRARIRGYEMHAKLNKLTIPAKAVETAYAYADSYKAQMDGTKPARVTKAATPTAKATTPLAVVPKAATPTPTGSELPRAVATKPEIRAPK